ncbi:hypothetical protein EVAR_19559_1 [Eumeta japonica]|uniref:Reverse transcriptase domain-containing protein n=1 Tax=Eumeta variegata TaxID=151549 RepID=A0A4C1UFG3_EUMVA|nr:hypothetical protein EVAR_19559_1 [Eumeta japonica]
MFSHHSHNGCDYNEAITRSRRVVPVWSAKTTLEHAPGVAVKKIGSGSFHLKRDWELNIQSSILHRSIRMDESPVKCFLYADDQAIHAQLACGLQEIVNKMNDSFKKRAIKSRSRALAGGGRRAVGGGHKPSTAIRGRALFARDVCEGARVGVACAALVCAHTLINRARAGAAIRIRITEGTSRVEYCAPVEMEIAPARAGGRQRAA